MDITWLTAFLDLEAHKFEPTVSFWQAVTGTRRSAPRGDHAEFATLVPPDGNATLKVQRIGDGVSGVHLDIHVAAVAEAVDHALAVGAEQIAAEPVAILSSPAGMTFCIVPGAAASTLPPPRSDPTPHAVDQLCIDIPAGQFEDEVTFWAALTRQTATLSSLPEYVVLEGPHGLPFRLLLQRLGRADRRTAATAHLDLACGDTREQVASSHLRLGAILVRDSKHWTVMRDPAGLPYCLTRRRPANGRTRPQT